MILLALELGFARFTHVFGGHAAVRRSLFGHAVLNFLFMGQDRLIGRRIICQCLSAHSEQTHQKHGWDSAEHMFLQDFE